MLYPSTNCAGYLLGRIFLMIAKHISPFSSPKDQFSEKRLMNIQKPIQAKFWVSQKPAWRGCWKLICTFCVKRKSRNKHFCWCDILIAFDTMHYFRFGDLLFAHAEVFSRVLSNLCHWQESLCLEKCFFLIDCKQLIIIIYFCG